jgi:hypothetical protein
MPETEIKRVNFFDGQFLKDLEFQEEQKYHLHMRRRMNHFLFEKSGVISGNNELDFINIDIPNKQFHVKAGMAVGKNNTEMETREIILRNDLLVDLNSEGISAGQTAFITIRYAEERVKEPPSEGEKDLDTRVKEKALIEVFSQLGDIPSPTPEGDEYILLGALDFDTMTKTSDSDTVRQEAKIRVSLLGGTVPLPAPIITEPSFGDGTEDARRKQLGETLSINGENFYEPLTVSFPNETTDGPLVEAPGTVVSQTEATVVVPSGINSGKVHVTTNSGTSNPSPKNFVLETN